MLERAKEEEVAREREIRTRTRREKLSVEGRAEREWELT